MAETRNGKRGRAAPGPLTYVLRSMKRDGRRIRASIAGITICTALLVVFLSLSAGIEDRLESDSEDFREVSYAVKSWLGALVIMITILLGVIVANTLVVSVHKRKKELATLLALGLTRWNVTLLIVMEGLVITLFAYFLGVGIGLLLSLANSLLFRGSGFAGYFLPESVGVTTLLFSLAISLGIALLASVIPAALIGRMGDIRELRYE